jgi:hypothetical protein
MARPSFLGTFAFTPTECGLDPTPHGGLQKMSAEPIAIRVGRTHLEQWPHNVH